MTSPDESPAVAADELNNLGGAAARADHAGNGAAMPDNSPPLDAAGRPILGAPSAPVSGDPQMEAALKMLLLPVFELFFPGWRVQPQECEALAKAWLPVIELYFPGGLSALGPWGGALLCTVAVVGPRVAMRVPRHLPPPAPPAAPAAPAA